jgi:hypothetical protein
LTTKQNATTIHGKLVGAFGHTTAFPTWANRAAHGEGYIFHSWLPLAWNFYQNLCKQTDLAIYIYVCMNEVLFSRDANLNLMVLIGLLE